MTLRARLYSYTRSNFVRRTYGAGKCCLNSKSTPSALAVPFLAGVATAKRYSVQIDGDDADS